ERQRRGLPGFPDPGAAQAPPHGGGRAVRGAPAGPPAARGGVLEPAAGGGAGGHPGRGVRGPIARGRRRGAARDGVRAAAVQTAERGASVPARRAGVALRRHGPVPEPQRRGWYIDAAARPGEASAPRPHSPRNPGQGAPRERS
ncbi:unnamed protein product, partial [Prorocentrum cordatum]